MAKYRDKKTGQIVEAYQFNYNVASANLHDMFMEFEIKVESKPCIQLPVMYDGQPSGICPVYNTEWIIKTSKGDQFALLDEVFWNYYELYEEEDDNLERKLDLMRQEIEDLRLEVAYLTKLVEEYTKKTPVIINYPPVSAPSVWYDTKTVPHQNDYRITCCTSGQTGELK